MTVKIFFIKGKLNPVLKELAKKFGARWSFFLEGYYLPQDRLSEIQATPLCSRCRSLIVGQGMLEETMGECDEIRDIKKRYWEYCKLAVDVEKMEVWLERRYSEYQKRDVSGYCEEMEFVGTELEKEAQAQIVLRRVSMLTSPRSSR